jgi:hypothetical protein
METSWPGTWLLFAWVIFMTAGVGGTIGWAAIFYFGGKLFNKNQVNTFLSTVHMILYEIGVVGATSITAAVGYVGGRFVLNGGSPIVAAQAIASQIIPPLSSDPNSVFNDMPPVLVAAFTGITVLATIVGLLTFLIAKSRPETMPPPSMQAPMKTSTS